MMNMMNQYQMNFTLNNGEIVADDQARSMVVRRLIIYGYSLKERRAAAITVTSKESGHYGYTIAALVREARDLIIERFWVRDS